MASLIGGLFDQVNPFDDGKTLSQRKTNSQIRQEREERERIRQPLRQRAANLARDQHSRGNISTDSLNQRIGIIRNDSMPRNPVTQWDSRKAAFGDAIQRNRIANPILGGAASAPIHPARLMGNIGQLAGGTLSAVGANSAGNWLENKSDRLTRVGQLDNQNVGSSDGSYRDLILRGGTQLATELPFFAAGGVARAIPLAGHFTSAGNEQYQNAKEAGYDQRLALGSGLALGAGNAALERIGFKGMTTPGVGKGIRALGTRVLNSGLTEGVTEGAQQLLENTFAKASYDRNRELIDGVAQSAIVGGVLGSMGRLPSEIASVTNNPEAQAEIKRAAKAFQERASLKPSPERAKVLRQAKEGKLQNRYKKMEQFTRAQDQGKKATAEGIAKQIAKLDKDIAAIDSELKGTSGHINLTGGDTKSPQNPEQPRQNSQQSKLDGQSLPQSIPNEPNTPSQEETASLNMMADQDPSQFNPEFNAVSAGSKKNNAKLVEAMKADKNLTDAARKAMQSGERIDFFAKKDANGRSVGIEQFNPRHHRIESGFVVDNDQNVLGNHIQVDETGVQVNVGGQLVNMDSVLGNPNDWKGNYRAMETMDRNIQRMAPDEKTYRKTRNFVIDHKIKNEANFREELNDQRATLKDRTKQVMKVKPYKTSKKEYKADIFDYIEGNKSEADIRSKYGLEATQQITQYKKVTRNLYDKLLDRVNTEYAKYGEPLVPRRENYLTHINELMNNRSFVGEMKGRLENSFTGEGQQTTRKSVPGDISGRTEGFQPRKRFNQYFQERKGAQDFTKDPFKAVDEYLEPTLYNIHMTSATVRARAVEAAFRTASEIKQMDKKTLSEQFSKELSKYDGSKDSKLVNGFQEYANALAGKTQRLDRQIVDFSKGGETALRGWQFLQRAGGRATILGNASSVISQTLNQPLAISDAGVRNYTKGVVSSIIGNTPIDKSPFIRARQTNVDKVFKGKFDKAMDIGGIPLQAVELASVKQTWNAEYHKAKSEGFKGQEAILEADRRTEQVVAGRGIADKPEAYRSTAINGLLQYTLEVSAANKKFWQDLSPKQKAEFVVASFAANSLVSLVTGFEPLPDFLGATIDSFGDFTDEEDKRSTVDKAINAGQRYAGEVVGMVPQSAAAANIFLDQNQRQAIFGEDSDIGRFEGTAAPVQVVRNLVDSGKSYLDGNTQDARNKLLKTVPYGNQAQKTIRGIEANNRGYDINKSGKPTYGAPDSTLGKVQSAIFGPFSTQGARNYYENNMTAITGKKDTAEIRAAEEAGQTDVNKVVDNIQARRQIESEKRKTKERENAERKSELDSQGGIGGGQENTEALTVRAKQLKDDAALYDKSLEDIRLERNLPESVNSYERLAAHVSGEYEDYLEAYNLKKDQPKRGSGEFSQLVEKNAEGDMITKAKKLYNEYPDIPQHIKERYYKELGISEQDIEYDIAAGFNSDEKASFLAESLQSMSYNQRIEKLTEYRQKSLSGDYLANHKTLDLLVDAGLISRRDAAFLKDVDYDKKSKSSKRKGKGRKAAKPKVNLGDYVVAPRVAKTAQLTSQSRPTGARYQKAQLRKSGLRRKTTAPKITVKRAIA